MKLRKAVYPGSFDPVTMGHLDIIRRAQIQFDELIILIAHAPEKISLFTSSERKKMLVECTHGFKNVSVDVHQGLTVEYLKQKGASVIVRGLRAVSDFEYELSMANMNFKLAPEIETMIIFARPEYTFLASRTVKEVAFHEGNIQGLVPPPVESAMIERIKELKRAKITNDK